MAKKNLATKLTMENLAVVLKDTFAYAEDLPTKVSELTNDSNYQTGAQVEASINAKIASVYKPGPSVAFENLPALTAANEGFVYNITNAFTTTADFVEGAGKALPAGTNIQVVDADATGENPTYKFDVFAGSYGDATQSGSGLMSATDKTKLDGFTEATNAEVQAVLDGIWADSAGE